MSDESVYKKYPRRTDKSKQYFVSGEDSALFWCSICNESFTRKYSLKRHKKIHKKKRAAEKFWNSQAKQFKPVNQDQLMKLQNLQKPLKDNMSDATACSICNKSFLRKDSLNRHMKIHTKKRTSTAENFCKFWNSKANQSTGFAFECHLCKKILPSFKRFEQHICRRHVRPEVECIVCKETFQNSTDLTKHIRISHLGHLKQKDGQWVEPVAKGRLFGPDGV